jgi:hypothetical protein
MRPAAILLLAAAAAPALAQTPSVPVFADETAAAGLDTPYLGEWEYMVGGGVATFDCNGDERPEVWLSGGAGPASLFLNDSLPGGKLALTPIESRLEVAGATGAYPADVDGDGLTDLLILRVGENLLMRGRGSCRFERANELWGFDGGDGWSAAAAITWEPGAAWPTIAVGNYIDRTQTAFPWGSCTPNWLHRPGTPGRFAPPVELTPSFCALSMLFTDWNRSGTPALRVSNDREYYKGGQEQLWQMGPAPRLFTDKDGWKRLRIWGMGIAGQDLDGDGYPEYFLTSMADNRLQVLTEGAARPAYGDGAFPLGITAHRPYTGGDIHPSTAWHAQWEDVNADGRPDLFIVKGNVAKMPDFALSDPNNLLLRREDGTFVEAGDRAGVASLKIGRGGVLADLNADGRLDMVVQNRWTGPEVWRNTGAGAGNWVGLRLSAPGPNRDAIGAWIEIRQGDSVLTREVTIGGGHASGHLGWISLGLGAAETAEVRVLWPGQAPGPWQGLPANRFWRLSPGADPEEFVPR